MAMAWCKATGIFDKMMSDVVAQKAPATDTKENVVLEIYHLLPSFLIIGAGLVLSSTAFCLETNRGSQTRVGQYRTKDG